MIDNNVSDKAILGKNVRISNGAIIYDNVEIGDNTFIGPYAIIGEPNMGYYSDPDGHVSKKTIIGANSIIRAHSTIYEDVVLGEYFQSGHYTLVRSNTIVGHHSSCGSYSELLGTLKIGNYVRIHSKVILCENLIVEDYVWFFPYVMTTNAKHPPVSELSQMRVKEYAQILSHALILPGITIGKNAIVGAGALVTKDVDDERLVIGNPAKDVKSVRDIKDSDGNSVYPWREHIKEYRGYPWQVKTDD